MPFRETINNLSLDNVSSSLGYPFVASNLFKFTLGMPCDMPTIAVFVGYAVLYAHHRCVRGLCRAICPPSLCSFGMPCDVPTIAVFVVYAVRYAHHRRIRGVSCT